MDKGGQGQWERETTREWEGGAQTRATPQAESQRFSRPRSEAGQARSARNAGGGPGAWGTFQGRPQARGASLRNSAPS